MKTKFAKKHIKLSDVTEVQTTLRQAKLNTVCESAKCPNIGECFGKKIATFLIAGDTCTRQCKFCAINKGNPKPLDPKEPERIANTIKNFGLKYAVITSVTRDDLYDGAAGHFFETVKSIREISPDTKVEILVPDFNGNQEAAEISFSSNPDVFSHNLETVAGLYDKARKGACYKRSLSLLTWAKQKGLRTKSGMMLGLGEKEREVLKALRDLRKTGCEMVTLGQYLAPSKKHHPVVEYIQPDVFEYYKKVALKMGFRSCLSGPYVRSSYQADQMFE
ncbi:MAG: lipoyl synthase [Elusimicrobiota bacterium]